MPGYDDGDVDGPDASQAEGDGSEGAEGARGPSDAWAPPLSEAWRTVPALLACPARIHRADYRTAELADLESFSAPILFRITAPGVLHGLAFWFDLLLTAGCGPPAARHPVVLSTAPWAPATHWNQTLCLFRNPAHCVPVHPGDLVVGYLTFSLGYVPEEPEAPPNTRGLKVDLIASVLRWTDTPPPTPAQIDLSPILALAQREGGPPLLPPSITEAADTVVYIHETYQT